MGTFVTNRTASPAELPAIPPKHHRFLFLDCLRGIAAILIVLYHAPNFVRPQVQKPQTFLAVDLFFALSGFVIAFAYEQRLSQGLSFKDFAVARVIRLYPVYLLAISMALLLTVAGKHASDLSWHAVMFSLLLLPDFLQPARHPMFPLDGPAWSLFVEIVANLCYAALVRFKVARTGLLFLLSLVSAAAVALWVLRISRSGDIGTVRGDFAIGLARAGLSFFLGVLALRVYRTGRGRALIQRMGPVVPCGVIAVAVAALATGLTRPVGAQLTTVCFVFPVLIYLAACVRVGGPWTGLCVFLGETSYPLYLIHFPILNALYSRMFRQQLAAHPDLKIFVLPSWCPCCWGRHGGWRAASTCPSGECSRGSTRRLGLRLMLEPHLS